MLLASTARCPEVLKIAMVLCIAQVCVTTDDGGVNRLKWKWIQITTVIIVIVWWLSIVLTQRKLKLKI